MKKITELAINRPLLIVVIFFSLILFGALSYTNLNYNLLPKFDANVITVITTYRGASAEEIENTITKKIEDAVSSMEGIDKLNSSSMEGASIITIQLTDGTDVNDAQIDAQRKINAILSQLPSDVDNPIINKFSSDDIPVLRMGITANVDDKTLFDILDQQVKPLLANIKGVGDVSIIGGTERQIIINVNKEKAESYGLSTAMISQFVSASSLSTPAGKIENAGNEVSIKFDAKVGDAEELKNMIVSRTSTGGNIYLKDVAEVINSQTKVTQINHTNGNPSIGLQILKQSDANAVEVSKLVKERLTYIQNNQFKDIDFKYVIASDQSVYTLQSANAVMFDLFLAIVIVSIVMLLFLHSMRSSLFVLVALPASIIPTFIAMYIFGMSLNLMTLMALSLVVGILVDDSIVILENIMRHMEMGKNKRQATIDGRTEIGFTAMSITLVDVVVFLPMALAGGMIGNILREFALVVVFSTLMSLIVCFTITPMLASRWGKIVHLSNKTLWGRISIWFENKVNGLRDWYTEKLKWALGHKRWIFIAVIALFIGTFALMGNGFVGFSFMSKSDQGQLSVKLELDPTASLYQTNMVTMEVERLIQEEDVVDIIFSNVGYSSNGMLASSNSNLAEIYVQMVDKKHRTISQEDFGRKLQQKLSNIPGVKFTISEVGITGGANEQPIQIILKGMDRDSIKVSADRVQKLIESIQGTTDVEFANKNPKPEINIELDREKMALFGLNVSEVAMSIGTSFRGNDQTKYKYNGNEYSIMVQNDIYNKSSIDDVRNLTFMNSKGQKFTLSQFAKVEETMGESVLTRNDRLSSFVVNANVIGVSSGVVGQQIKDKLNTDSTILAKGVTWSPGGQMEMQSDSFSSLLLALGIGILLVYLIMVALYENAIYPFVVLFALPLAMIGAILALALTMNELTIFSMIGIIMLMGLVAKNGILLVDFTNQRKAEGATLVEALIDAGRERFRPIMMTTIAMIVGMLPIALASGSGAEVKNGMAWAIIGGLTSSLVLTLIVVPCVYYIVDKILNRFRRKKRNKLKKKVLERNAMIAE